MNMVTVLRIELRWPGYRGRVRGGLTTDSDQVLEAGWACRRIPRAGVTLKIAEKLGVTLVGTLLDEAQRHQCAVA